MATDVKDANVAPLLGWYPLDVNRGPAIGYRLSDETLHDIIKALLVTMPISEEKEHHRRSPSLSIVSIIRRGNIRVSRSDKGYTVSISRGSNIISLGKIYPHLPAALLAIKNEINWDERISLISSISVIAPGKEGGELTTIYRDLDEKDYSLRITGEKSTKVGLTSANQPNIILNKIPLDSEGRFHGIEERFFFTLNGKPANCRYWIHDKEVTLDEYAKYIIKELQENTSLIPDLAVIAGGYAGTAAKF